MPVEYYPLADYHVHPDFSFDAVGSLDDYCQMALQKGLAEICFTTHYDINPALPEACRVMRLDGKLKPHSPENFGHYVSAVEKAQEKYGPAGLTVRAGIEAGYFPGCEERIAELLNCYQLAYRLGAVHEVGEIHICDSDQMQKYAKKGRLEDLVDHYFDLAKQAVESGLFTALAHVDMYRMYGLANYGEKIWTVHRGRIEPLLQAMAACQVGLELNTSPLRRGQPEYYPSMEIVNLARRHGVPIVALGSDAHRPENVGYDFEAAAMIAYELFSDCGE